MSIIKIIRNVSGADKQVLQRTLANSESFTIPYHLWFELADNTSIASDISSGSLVVNNGSSDLSIANGLIHVKRFQFDDAASITFNNATNGFTAINAQTAIEEAIAKALSVNRFAIQSTFNGTVGNNDWLGYTHLIPGTQVPIRIPIKCKLKEIQFAYSNSSILGIPLGGDLVDGRFDLYKNGYTSPTNVVYQGSFVNQVSGKLFTNVNVSFNAGDYMVGRWVDQGDNPSDMAITYMFEVLL